MSDSASLSGSAYAPAVPPRARPTRFRLPPRTRVTSHATGSETCVRRRVTLVQCVLNTNESNGGASAVHELRNFLTDVLFTERALEYVVLESSTAEHARPKRIREIEIRAAAIEIGSVQKRPHAHWVMKITHSDLRLNVGRMQSALQALMQYNTSFSSPYAHVTLLNARPENYALKGVCDDISSESESGDSSLQSTVAGDA